MAGGTAGRGARPRSLLGSLALALVLVGAGLWWVQERDESPAASPGSSVAVDGGVADGADDGAADGEIDPESGLPVVVVADLPAEAAETLRLIDDGGPFPYPDSDGSTFGNYEGILPEHEHGYYAEYTVETPGSPDRGARRIVAGDGGELYWTDDHYASFSRIRR
ncbi:ribonuclease domain-containing protein [Nocardioides sp. YIM 152588]|uniref:ribonuclease domain-containing protein n=1 Tax=Nocardioides sp. YIM 152588 TaxID=3158259 RepID=UPI0032E4E129